MSFKRPKQLSVLISQRIIKRKTFIESLISIIQILEKDLAWIKNLFLHFYLFEVNRTHNSTFFSDCIGMQSANFRPFLSLYWQSEIDYQFSYMTLYYHDNILCSCSSEPIFQFCILILNCIYNEMPQRCQWTLWYTKNEIGNKSLW